MEDNFRKFNLYDLFRNKGELETGMNLKDSAVSANFTNDYQTQDNFFNAMVGGTYQPSNDQNRINPRLGAALGTNDMNMSGFMDDYTKSINANINNFSGGITKNADQELIKRLGYSNPNFSANMISEPDNTTYSVQGLLGKTLGGDITAEAMKDDYNKRIMFNYLKNF
mgnify:FL=1